MWCRPSFHGEHDLPFRVDILNVQKSFLIGDKIQILGDDTNKSEWRSWWNQEYVKFRECLLLFSPKSFVFPSHIKKPKD
jgi:hypothetical protein